MPQAIALLRSIASPDNDLELLGQLVQISRKTGLGRGGNLKVRIAIGGNLTLNYLGEALEFHLALLGFDAEIHIVNFGTLPQQALDPTSDLYEWKPDIIWIFSTARDLEPKASQASSERELSGLREIWQAVGKNSVAHIIQNNFDMPLIRVHGHLGPGIEGSAERSLAWLNVEIRNQASHTVFDYDWLSSQYGKSKWRADRFWYQAKYAFDPDATALVAYHGARTVEAILGRAKKCLVLDLDNTLWGGVVGEDGVEGIRIGPGDVEGEAFSAFQHYLRNLKERGILLAVCSKNDESVAMQPFQELPEMVLKPDDFSFFVANWTSKAENIKQIAEQVGIGLDSIVFVDDSDFERNLVRTLLPEVSVPEMPLDPADFVSTLDKHRYFEASTFSAEDSARTKMYADNLLRSQAQSASTDLQGYLENLAMVCEVREINERNAERVTQLINKSNQFNLTGEKRTRPFVDSLIGGKAHFGRCYRLEDRFGDSGIISALILRSVDDCLCVETWVMSCRVLGRGVEDFIYNDLMRLARSLGLCKIRGLYTPTDRNKLVSGLYQKLGFTPEAGGLAWELLLSEEHPKAKTIFIGEKKLRHAN